MSEHGGWGSPAPAPADPWAPHHDVLTSGHADRSPRPRRHRRAAILIALAAIALVLAAGAWAWQDRARQTDDLLDAITASEATMVEGQETLATSALDFEERLAAATPRAAPRPAGRGRSRAGEARQPVRGVDARAHRRRRGAGASGRGTPRRPTPGRSTSPTRRPGPELFAAAGSSEVTPEIQAEISRSWDAFTPALTDLGYDDASRAKIAVIIGPSGDGQGVGQDGDPNTIQA